MGLDLLVYILEAVLPLLLSFFFIALLPLLVVGIVVSVLQAATQIQESSLSYLPKLLVLTIIMLFIGSEFFKDLLRFSRELFNFNSIL